MAWVETKIDVRYQETDQMGIVYHANYIVWFEVGRMAFIKNLGFTYADMETEGILLPVINVNANYKLPVHFGETVTVKTRIKEYNNIRIMYEYHIIKEDGELAVSGNTEHSFVNAHTFKPLRLRNIKKEWHHAFMKNSE